MITAKKAFDLTAETALKNELEFKAVVDGHLEAIGELILKSISNGKDNLELTQSTYRSWALKSNDKVVNNVLENITALGYTVTEISHDFMSSQIVISWRTAGGV